MPNECPYHAENCPKVEDMERRIEKMETGIERNTKMLYYIAGLIVMGFGITGGMALW